MPGIGARGARWDVLDEQEMAKKAVERQKKMHEAMETASPEAKAEHAAMMEAGQKEGLSIWRVENLQLKPVPKDMHGHFYEGDTYVILSVWRKGMNASLNCDLFFWLGSESTVDEQGGAALLAVNMDNDVLGGIAVQHREVQGHETPAFINVLPDSTITVMKGGLASGFHHVEPEKHDTRLLHVKGKRVARVTVVEPKVSSLNSGDVFILDTGAKLIQWNGVLSNAKERRKAVQVCERIAEQRLKLEVEHTVYEQDEEVPDEFWTALGGKLEGGVPEKTAGMSKAEDEAAEAAGGELKMWHVHFEGKATGGTAERQSGAVQEVTQRPLTQAMLNSGDAYVFDFGGCVYLWRGKGASKTEIAAAGKQVEELMKEKPAWYPMARISEGHEPIVFTSQFAKWKVADGPLLSPEVQKAKLDQIRREEAKKKNANFGENDKRKEHEKPRGAAQAKSTDEWAASLVTTPEQQRAARQAYNKTLVEQSMLPGEGGEMTVWHLDDNFERRLLPKWAEMGMFRSEDNYIVKYTWKTDSPSEGIQKRTFLFGWRGSKATQLEKGSLALQLQKMDDEGGAHCDKMQIEMNSEPPFFLALFKGKLLVRDSAVSYGGQKEDDKPYTGSCLFKVHGIDPLAVRAFEVADKAASLSSADCFLLQCVGNVFVWQGGKSSDDERRVAMEVGNLLSRQLAGQAKADDAQSTQAWPVSAVSEGSEPEAFWAALVGGKGPYQTEPTYVQLEMPPRLFHASQKTGLFAVSELLSFSQEDLVENQDDVFILDAHSAVYVWVGSTTAPSEKAKAVETANKYITQASQVDGRTASTPVVQITSGEEPPPFTALFPSWDPDKARGFEDPYERKKRLMKEAAEKKAASLEAGEVVVGSANATPSEAKAKVKEVQEQAKTAEEAKAKGSREATATAEAKEVGASSMGWGFPIPSARVRGLRKGYAWKPPPLSLTGGALVPSLELRNENGNVPASQASYRRATLAASQRLLVMS
uniref:Gelsolin-like domain-containing protein n=1 Tax=Haptolina brevifila TaxID=156173 RepID=A0A7S2IB77_9EUKA|mmetsp:Transcript_63922/g.126373  ORF Transcript_63922/g.126373 Transcript_63922/m.126373 type:complete len:986 (+) Transcript_63922:7-2964(+)